jgi:hypothetical protein
MKELETEIPECDEGNIEGVLHLWPRIYAKLALV